MGGRQTSPVLAVVVIAALVSAYPARAQLMPSRSAGEVVARFGDTSIGREEVDQAWQMADPVEFARISKELFDGRRRAVEALLDDRVLQAEARTRGVSVERLIGDAVTSRAKAPTEAEINAEFENSRPEGVELDDVRSIIAAFLTQRAETAAKEAYVRDLRRAYADRTAIFLVDPVDAARGSYSAVAGNPDAQIEIVEFADFECPFCKQVDPVLKQIVEAFGDRVRVIWRDFPLAIHPHAATAAEAARCAEQQGGFWEYHDVLFDHQDRLAISDLRQYAVQLSLDPLTFDSCLASGITRQQIIADMEDGALRGVAGTPTVFINGEMLSGAHDYADYETVIRRELEHTVAAP